MSWKAAFWADDSSWSNPGDGNSVSSWRDYSGNGRDLSQATGSQQPKFRATVAALNGRAGVEFDGSDDRMLTSSWTATSQPTSMILVCELVTVPVGSTGWYAMIGNVSSGFNSLVVFDYSGTKKWTLRGGSPGEVGPIASTGALVMRGKMNGTSSVYTVNGTSYSSGSNVGSDTSNGVTLGGYYGAGSFYVNVRIGFAGIYVGDITSHANWNDFKTWVSDFYGLTLT